MTLDELAKQYGADKSSDFHNYTPIYERHFGVNRESIKKVLEFGVLQGASLRMWKDYFPNAQIFGMDIQLPTDLTDDRITLIEADCTSFASVLRMADFGDYDLIVDDASHRIEAMIQSWNLYWPLVAPGGTYVIEDTCEVGWSKKQEMFGQFIMTRFHNIHLGYGHRHGIARRFETVAKSNPLSNYELTVSGLHVYNSLVMIEKR